ncbi:MAG: hypothetical protein JXR76_12995 [Deltaproteobacteria bacterium]|nr:hypothetical protein [Deltaproteobacteria bacterium]
MKSSFFCLIFMVVLSGADVASAATYFHSARITMVALNSSGDPTGDEFTQSFTTRTAGVCTSGLQNNTTNCTRYKTFMSMGNTSQTWRGSFTHGTIRMDLATMYDEGPGTDVIVMQNAFPDLARRWWRDPLPISIGPADGGWTFESWMCYQGCLTNDPESDEYLYIRSPYSEMRFKYSYRDDPNDYGREISFSWIVIE